MKNPEELFKEIKETVIGQDESLKKMCTAIWLHKTNISFYQQSGQESVKPNVLMIGNSGSGKTLMLKEISKIMDVPIVIEDATAFTGTGWKGRSVDDALSDLFMAADRDVKKAECGIIVFDEIDKVVKPDSENATFSPINGMLKMIEGCIMEVPSKDGMISIDTSKIQFVCAGAFDGLEEIVLKRVNTNTLGFGSNLKLPEEEKNKLLKKVTRDDLLKYGVGNQFLGRFPFLIKLNPLNQTDLSDILYKSRASVIKSLNRLLMECEGVGINISRQACNMIAMQALNEQSGARALSALVIELLEPYLFQVASDEKISSIDIKQKKGSVTVTLREGYRKKKAVTKKKVQIKPVEVELNLSNIEETDLSLLADEILSHNMQGLNMGLNWKDIRAAHLLMCSILEFVREASPQKYNCQSLLNSLNSISTGLFEIAVQNQFSKASEWYAEARMISMNWNRILEIACDAINDYACENH